MIRIDKYLCAVRLYKTRTIASEACKKERVLIGGKPVKPSRTINVGEIIFVKEPPTFREYKILDISEKRMGAKLVPNFLEEITSEENLEILKLTQLSNKMNRQHGTGRPTKKERRELEIFLTNE
ncbi:MAG: S4 domain-containing protein [Marinilabiliaceae bacterium]|nr:S4 domain-containing protein [Marinilabiliaceae bacterium]